ncbi:putative dihydroxyacetone kinase [Tothia fuscella]|uniref:Dihydroxyacetone kinase n=1 Tax=Tothia fuscella TaxID=1048955 RepID=A0A9P4NTR6_9PEZI|nr:putative dihydroxyacetone kinase [Tothia fuscella]
MSNKHFFTDPSSLLSSALHAVTLTSPSLSLDSPNKIIHRRSKNDTQVSLLSGGGSGHEPSFTSLVGSGLLTASVAGTIFASPSASQIRTAILNRVSTKKGVLVIVMNYTGDVLNFGMGVEKARVGGIEVDMVVVGDDVGVGREQGGKVGRRGIAGTVLVVKIAGALAETGASLKEVGDVARLVAENVVSVGASLNHVHVPGRGASEDDNLGSDEVEVGMGIHNEPGSERVKTDLTGLVKKMLKQMLDISDQDRGFIELKKEDDCVLLINNLGGVSVLEMGGIANEVIKELEGSYGIKPLRILCGTYMTSLNGMGFSISLLRLKDTGLGSGKSMLNLLDAPAEAVGWAAPIAAKTWEAKRSDVSVQELSVQDAEEETPGNLKFDFSLAKKVVTTALKRVIAAEPDITRYDTIVGDGDCGIGLKRGAEAVLEVFGTSKETDDVLVFLQRVTKAIEASMDGTSGAIYAIFFNALTSGVREQSPTSSSPAAEVREKMQVGIWARALETSMIALGRYTPAKVGDRTLVDALAPFVGTLSKTGNVQRAADAANEGAKKTKGMKASLGRSVYVGNEHVGEVPDPGAYGLAEILLGLSEGLK